MSEHYRIIKEFERSDIFTCKFVKDEFICSSPNGHPLKTESIRIRKINIEDMLIEGNEIKIMTKKPMRINRIRHDAYLFKKGSKSKEMEEILIEAD